MLIEEIQSYNNLELLAKQVVEGFITGLHKSPFHGFSVEFAEHRPYNAGESTRNIDWKLFARTDKVFVKRFEEETNLRCRILLDLSSSMYYPEKTLGKLKFSVLAAASICSLLYKQRDAFGVSTFHSDLGSQTSVRSSLSHFGEVMRLLQNLWETKNRPETKVETHIARALEHTALSSHRRSLIVIFSDMFENGDNEEAIWRSLQHLRFLKNEVILFHVTHKPEESELKFDNRPLKFTDIESGEQLIVNPSEVREHFLQKTAALDNQVKQRCLQYGIDFYSIDVSQNLHQVLTPFYIKRMKMG
jgi:uncharacterized protein (DUF58 family)